MKIHQLHEISSADEYRQTTAYGEPVFIIEHSSTGDFSPFNKLIAVAAKKAMTGGHMMLKVEVRNALKSTKGLSKADIGEIDVSRNDLISMEGLEWFDSFLNISSNNLTELRCAKTMHALEVDNNDLHTLTGGPKHLSGHYSASHNKLTDFSGAPVEVSQSLHLSHNQISSWSGVSGMHIQDDLDLTGNKLSSMRGVDKVLSGCEDLILTDNPPPKHVLNLFNVDEIRQGVTFDDAKLSKIINKHLHTGGKEGMLDCQEELIDAGYSQEVASL